MRSNRIRTTALAATALLAALSLTACSGDDGNSESSKAGSAAPAASVTDKQAQSPTAAPEKGATDSGTNTGSSNGSSNGTGTGSKTGTGAPAAKTDGKNTSDSTGRVDTTCVAENTKITVTKVSRPVNHLLLTMTNSGSGACNAYYAPKLRFDDAQAVFPILDSSQPQAVVTIDPGQSAYASIGLSGEDDQKNLHEGKNLGVHFSSKNAEGDTGTPPAELTLPAGTYWGDNGFVSYWQTEMADALQY